MSRGLLGISSNVATGGGPERLNLCKSTGPPKHRVHGRVGVHGLLVAVRLERVGEARALRHALYFSRAARQTDDAVTLLREFLRELAAEPACCTSDEDLHGIVCANHFSAVL